MPKGVYKRKVGWKNKSSFNKGHVPWNKDIKGILSGKYSPNWKGGKHIRKDGYVFIYAPNHPNKSKSNYVMEHRLVVEKNIKRLLTSEEIVHHINGITHDNRIKNLLILTKSEHQRIHHTKKRRK